MSAVWTFFTIDENDTAIANCNTCKMKVSRGGKEKAAFNTTNLIRHLKNKHPQRYTEFAKSSQPPRTTQPTLLQTLKKKEKMPRDGEKAQAIISKISQMIAISDQPFAFVDNPGLIMLLDFLEPRFEMPSRHYFTEKALPALQKKVKDKLLGLLKDVPFISFTTDIWSSSVAPMSLLSLTAQWVDSAFVLRHATLHAQEFRGSHTAERIKEAVEKMLTNWGIDKQRVHVILRDNAANMKRAMSEMGVRSAGCVAHLCQLCVHEGVLAQRSVTDTLAIARKIVGHFKHSPLAYSRLEDIQTELNMDIKRLQQDVQTRWNSSLYMLQSLMEQKWPLSVYSTERTLPAVLTAYQWDLMKKVADVLSSFEELTRELPHKSANLTLAKEHLIQELVNKEEKARAVVSEAAAGPDTKAPRLETKTFCKYNNNKPWFTAKLRRLRQDEAYGRGDRDL
ncbi:zinc finger BED domain-containing protein 4-like [Oryzias melastigma]|uniref:zinc finger BED domain-containing protein 4-like n=1 Tax=Oryzias melastigma TaxID=30732 RepID=UPI00168D0396|nr:zinc finger BED domain-containing protein 4-like [Oryzias melastigma]